MIKVKFNQCSDGFEGFARKMKPRHWNIQEYFFLTWNHQKRQTLFHRSLALSVTAGSFVDAVEVAFGFQMELAQGKIHTSDLGGDCRVLAGGGQNRC